MKRLLCATDLLPKSESAIDRAGALAHEIDADLSLLHVVSPTASSRILEQSLQIAIARMKLRVRPPLWRAGPTPNVLVRTGNPARLILDTVAEEQPDVLIVGPHRKRSVVDALEGTIAQKVLSARKCALLMVQRPVTAGYRNVLLALDLSVGSGGVVTVAESLLCNSVTQATVVYAHEPRPVPTLQRAIEFHRPDLLVLGTRGNGPLRRATMGSVANQLLQRVECDVLVVPRGSVETSNLAQRVERSAICRIVG